MSDFENLDEDDPWDEEFASDLVGSTLLVGLTYVDHDGEFVRRQQIFGTVISVGESSGIVIRQHRNGETFTIAPVLDAIEAGDPGIYQMADADEEVEDPDFTALITVRSPLRS